MLLNLGKLKIGIAWASAKPGIVNSDMVLNHSQILAQKLRAVIESESVAGY